MTRHQSSLQTTPLQAASSKQMQMARPACSRRLVPHNPVGLGHILMRVQVPRKQRLTAPVATAVASTAITAAAISHCRKALAISQAIPAAGRLVQERYSQQGLQGVGISSQSHVHRLSLRGRRSMRRRGRLLQTSWARMRMGRASVAIQSLCTRQVPLFSCVQSFRLSPVNLVLQPGLVEKGCSNVIAWAQVSCKDARVTPLSAKSSLATASSFQPS